MMRESVSICSGGGSVGALGAHRVEHAGLALEGDLSAGGLLDAVGLHVDVLLHLARQLGAVRGEQPPQVPCEDVELLEVRVSEGQHLREEGVEPHVVGELAPEVLLLLGQQRLEAVDCRSEHSVEPVLRGFRVEVGPGERVDVGLRIDRERREPVLNLVKQIRVSRFRQQRGFVVGLKGGLDLIGLVGEVEHHRALLLWVRPVAPRQRLHCIHAAELLVHVHRMERRLVEAGLELVGDDQEAVLGPLEGVGSLRLRERVHAGLGEGPTAVLDSP